jgi:hypothetical protein
MAFFFINRKVDPKPLLDNAKILNIEFNTAICLRNLEEATYILPRLMENMIKYTVALKGGSPLKGVYLEVHLPFLTDRVEEGDDVKRRQESIKEAFGLYEEMSKYRFSYLGEANPSIDIIKLLNNYKSFVGCLEVYIGERIF